MRFALLGPDDHAMKLVRAATASPTHAVSVAYGGEAYRGELDRLGIRHESAELWEALLHEPVAEGVIVGSDPVNPQRAEQLRRLAQAAMPMILVHPACDMLLGFELQMIQRDTKAAILPYLPGLHHPWIRAVSAWIADASGSPIGRVSQLVMERPVAVGSPLDFLRQFSCDALVLRVLMGRIDRVNAMASGPRQPDASPLDVQLANDDLLARWTWRPDPAPGPALVSLVGSGGQALAHLPSDPAAWTLTVNQKVQLFRPPPDPGSSLDQIADVAQSVVWWDHAVRALELTDALQTSRRRGRTIDLHQEEVTEEGTFKSLMAATGCGLLCLILVTTMLLAVIESASPYLGQYSAWRRLPWRVLLGGLVIFLGLQLLRLVFPRPPGKDRPPSVPEGPRGGSAE
jgi:hypothetical protein